MYNYKIVLGQCNTHNVHLSDKPPTKTKKQDSQHEALKENYKSRISDHYKYTRVPFGIRATFSISGMSSLICKLKELRNSNTVTLICISEVIRRNIYSIHESSFKYFFSFRLHTI